MIRWEFPARGELPAVELRWYDGGLRPPMPAELKPTARRCRKRACSWSVSGARSWPAFSATIRGIDSEGPHAGLPAAGGQLAAAHQRVGSVRSRLSRRGAFVGML